MRYSRVAIESLGYELGPNVVTSRALEDRLAPLYQTLRIQAGQLEALTGIRERRFWDAGTRPSQGALRAARRMENFKKSLATMTGGSGAVAVVLSDTDLAFGHRLLGGAVKAAPEHHGICRWGPDTGIPPSGPMVMETDAVAVLQHGVV